MMMMMMMNVGVNSLVPVLKKRVVLECEKVWNSAVYLLLVGLLGE